MLNNYMDFYGEITLPIVKLPLLELVGSEFLCRFKKNT
jgi:hypothetical protein